LVSLIRSAFDHVLQIIGANLSPQALNHFHVDEDVKASRILCLAARFCLELGLNRRHVLERFPWKCQSYSGSETLLVDLYAGRRSSLGIGVPFVIQDHDVDPSMPEPVSAA
jgi:hypothetical protein